MEWIGKDWKGGEGSGSDRKGKDWNGLIYNKKMKIKRRFKQQQNITMIRDGKVKILKTPYTPSQAKEFRDGR